MSINLKKFVVCALTLALFLPYLSLPQRAQAGTTEQTGQYPPSSVDFNISDAGDGQPKMIVYWTANMGELNTCDANKLWWQIDVYETDSGYHTDGAKHILSTYNSNYTEETKNVDGTGWGKYYKAIIGLYCNSASGDKLLGRAANTIFLNQKDQVKPGDSTCTAGGSLASAAATVENFDDGTKTVHLTWTYSTDPKWSGYGQLYMKIVRPDGQVITPGTVDRSVNDNYENGETTKSGNYTLTSLSNKSETLGSCTVPVTFSTIDTGTETGKTGKDGEGGVGDYTPINSDDTDCGCKGGSSTFINMFVDPICGVMCAFITAMVDLAAQIIDWFPQAVQAYIHEQGLEPPSQVVYFRN